MSSCARTRRLSGAPSPDTPLFSPDLARPSSTAASPPAPAKPSRTESLPALEPDASGEERVLHHLINGELSLADEFRVLEFELIARTMDVLPDARRAHATARTLREVVAAATAVNRRVQNAVGVLTSLRLQRRMMQVKKVPKRES